MSDPLTSGLCMGEISKLMAPMILECRLSCKFTNAWAVYGLIQLYGSVSLMKSKCQSLVHYGQSEWMDDLGEIDFLGGTLTCGESKFQVQIFNYNIKGIRGWHALGDTLQASRKVCPIPCEQPILLHMSNWGLGVFLQSPSSVYSLVKSFVMPPSSSTQCA
ncbi:hypothetical protein VNO77_03203 [Canavalia gladiata]|uniref:Uncharacterized protein n=1 Tax=Canavalia gladiata TaxID=3824 RepID=A0AAN9R6L6_CANGL